MTDHRKRAEPASQADENHEYQMIGEFDLPGEPGNDRLAMEKVAQVLAPLRLEKQRLDRLKTAVAEATLNALEHGSRYQHEVPVTIRVRVSQKRIAVEVTNFGDTDIPLDPELPDLEAKMAGEQKPRGWGFFLIQHLVDEVHITNQPARHTIELFVNRQS
jgi:anti-sigma regulatory factor (Ser/Thr protein kinase)